MKKKDWALVVGVLAAAGVFWLLRWRSMERGGEARARIYVADTLYREAPLSEKGEIVIRQDNGAENVVWITDTGVVMHSANCRNQDCVRTGEIGPKDGNQANLSNWIVCLPNRVSVELVTEDTV